MSATALRSPDVVRQARLCLGLSQMEFGNLIQRSQGIVSKYEKGVVQPNGDTLMHCLNILSTHKGASVPVLTDEGWQAIHQAMAQLSAALAALEQRSR